jgi:hypothetical protein
MFQIQSVTAAMTDRGLNCGQTGPTSQQCTASDTLQNEVNGNYDGKYNLARTIRRDTDCCVKTTPLPRSDVRVTQRMT